MRRTLSRQLRRGAVVCIAAAATFVVAPSAYAQYPNEGSATTSWVPTYSQADILRMQTEMQLRSYGLSVTSSVVQHQQEAYRAVVTYVR